MKRRVLLVDDEVAVLLTLKAVLEISGFDVDTATSAREGKARIRHREYEMVITDMRMEDERAGEAVIAEARSVPYKPAVALLTAFPVDEPDWQDMGADKMLVKPMHTRALLQQLEALLVQRERELAGKAPAVPAVVTKKSAAKRSATVKKVVTKKYAKKTAQIKKSVRKLVKKATKKVGKTVKKASKAAAKKPVKMVAKAGKKAAKKVSAGKKTSSKKVALAKKAALTKPATKKVISKKAVKKSKKG